MGRRQLVPLRDAPPAHDLVEAARLSVALALLVEQRQVLRVELLEEFVPADRHERFLPGLAGEVDAQNPEVLAAGALDRRRTASARLDPALDLLVIRRGLCHEARPP